MCNCNCSKNEVDPEFVDGKDGEFKDAVFFARINPTAVIPSKRYEDGAYDFYADFPESERRLIKGKANLVPSGIASAMSPKYRLNLKQERSSTGKYAMSVIAGMVDSGYRGQIFYNLCPLHKDVIISKTYPFPTENGKEKPVELDDVIMYPYYLAVLQGKLEIVPDVDVIEISYEELKNMKSERGDSCLGASGK